MPSENSALIVLESYCLFPSSEHTSAVALFAVSFPFSFMFLCHWLIVDWVIQTVVSWLITFLGGSFARSSSSSWHLNFGVLPGSVTWTSFLLCTSTPLLIFMTHATADFQILNLQSDLFSEFLVYILSCLCNISPWSDGPYVLTCADWTLGFHSPTFSFYQSFLSQ